MSADSLADAPLLPLEVEEHLNWLGAERGRSPNTVSAYRRDLRRYVAWLVDQGRSLDDVDTASLASYVAHLREAGVAPASLKRALVAVRSLHRFLLEEGIRPSDPTADLEVPSAPRGLPKAISEAEVEALIGCVVGDDPVARRDRAMLEVLYGTGVRISELVGVSLGDVDLDAALLRVKGKGDRERVVPLGRMAGRAVGDWLDLGGRPAMVPERWARRGDAEALFLNQRGGRLSRQGAWSVVRRHGRSAGLEDRLTPHVLRHSCATHMLDHGADIRAVQELLGHASIGTTQVYTLVSSERLRAVYESAHPRARLGREGENSPSYRPPTPVPSEP